MLSPTSHSNQSGDTDMSNGISLPSKSSQSVGVMVITYIKTYTMTQKVILCQGEAQVQSSWRMTLMTWPWTGERAEF